MKMKNKNAKRMKTSHSFAVLLIVLTLCPALCQAQPGTILDQQAAFDPRQAAGESKLTKFNLDFPGGTPKQLVAAIEKATGKPLNAIVPDEDAGMKLPPLKMNNVNVQQLFQALGNASVKSERYNTGPAGGFGGRYPSYQVTQTRCGFETFGAPSDDSIWYFHVEKPPSPSVTESLKSCRFYALSPYLERGLTVDDITTAIQTGWKMLGDADMPHINFHKDTKLLIAVGEERKLETIDAVLKALTPPTPPAEKKTEPKPGEKKAEK
jgi:hypothetical protein